MSISTSLAALPTSAKGTPQTARAFGALRNALIDEADALHQCQRSRERQIRTAKRTAKRAVRRFSRAALATELASIDADNAAELTEVAAREARYYDELDTLDIALSYYADFKPDWNSISADDDHFDPLDD